MKFSFYLLAILFSCQSFGQNPIPNYEIGHFVDLNKQLIKGYSDFDYESEHSLNVSYVINDNFTDGFYFDKEGLKIKGILKYSMKDRDLKFKLNKDDVEKSIKADECKGYVIGVDTFAVVKNVEIIGFFGDTTSENGEFAEIMERVSGMTFYKFVGISQKGSYERYIVKKSDLSECLTFPNSKGKFKKMALDIFDSDLVLKAGIENGKYKTEDLPSMVKIFKYRKLFEGNQKILFNASWDETNNSVESNYYAKIESVKDSVFHLSYFLNNDIKIYEGDFTSFYPHRKSGTFVFYFLNGSIRRKVNYSNNKPKNEIEYFLNQNIHRISKQMYEDDRRIYDQVNNEKGESVLDKDGNGKEVFFDLAQKREITYEYIKHFLDNIYYLNKNGEKVYQLCHKNAKLTDLKDLQKSISDNFIYPAESINKYIHGYAMVKCIIEPTGLVSEVQLIKGVDMTCDIAITDFLTCLKTKAYWKPGKVNGVPVQQEIIIPIDFSIISFSAFKNNYNNSWQFHQMMFQQQMMNNQQWMNQQMMRVPTGRF
jgi:hypothetical protein